MGQLFDHLGYTIIAEWYIVGEYKTERLQGHSVAGRLGDIRGRPNEVDKQMPFYPDFKMISQVDKLYR